MYVLKYIAHELREEVFEENNKERHQQNKKKAQAWMNSITGKYHIREMNWDETVRLVAELYCKGKYGSSLKSLAENQKIKPKNNWKKNKYYKQIVRIPLTKLALFFGVIQYRNEQF